MTDYCWCPKSECINHGNSKACMLKHRVKNEAPSCFFGQVKERIVDKSFKNFA